MKRQYLLDKLELVAPALHDSPNIPILTHFWFTGSHLMAYNDEIGLSTPLETDFVGAVPQTLLALLRASAAEEIKIESTKTHLSISGDRTKLRLALMPEDSFVFEMPKMPKGFEVENIDKIIEAFELCAMSIGSDKAIPDQLGITVIWDDKGEVADLYSTNFSTLTHTWVDHPMDADRVIIPAAFVSQVISLSKKAKEADLRIADDHALFIDDDGTYLFGRIVESSDPMDFVKLMDDHLPPKLRKSMLAIPDEFKGMLDRAAVICDSKTDRYTTRVSVANGEIVFESKSDRGEVRDVLKTDSKTKVALSVEPKLFRRGVDVYDDYLLTERCVILAKGNAEFMVAALGKAPTPMEAPDDDPPWNEED